MRNTGKILENATRMLLLTVLLFGIHIIPCEAVWKGNDVDGWWYSDDSASGYVTGFKTIDGTDYYFNQDGWMETGWFHVDGKWYFAGKKGNLYKDKVTPDGYTVDKNGAWDSNIAREALLQLGNEHVTIYLPADWGNKFFCKIYENGDMTFYHILNALELYVIRGTYKSRLFWIEGVTEEDGWRKNADRYSPWTVAYLGTDGNISYIFNMPTEAECNLDNEELREQYLTIMKDVSNIADGIQIR